MGLDKYDIFWLETNFRIIKKRIAMGVKVTQQMWDDMVSRLDKIADDIAADYALLIAEAKKGEVSEESVQRHEVRVKQLEDLGASVDNPVPPPPDLPPVEGEKASGSAGSSKDDLNKRN